MKIFILSDGYAPHTRRWVNWFAENNHKVFLITFNSKVLPNYSEKVEEIFIINPKYIGRLYVGKFIGVLFLLTRLLIKYLIEKPDLVHSHTSGGYAWAPFVLRLKNRFITPWGTDILVDINESKINYFFTSKSLQNAKFVTTDAEFFKSKLLELGVKNEKIYTHNFGTDVNKFKSNSVKSYRSINTDELVIISTRTPNPVHDVNCFIECIPHVLKIKPNIKFIVVGGGSELDFLIEKSKKLGVFNSINFTGMVEEEEMISLLESAHVYVSTSFMDAGLAGSTAEAMSMNKPVISTDNSDNRLWVHENKGGYLFENSDSLSLAKKILLFINNPKKIVEYGLYNRSLIESKYNTDIELKYVEELYSALKIPKR